MEYLLWEIYGLSFYNLLVLWVYGVDKLKAKKGDWRISERFLIVLAFLLGGIGALLGMVLFNHKTSKMKFRILVPLAFLLNLALYILFFWDSIQ